MRRSAGHTVALIHRLLAYTFAFVGLLFLLAPNGTVRTINAVGAVFRVFPPAAESDLRFWLSLGFAYMVLVTVLAWRIAADPYAHRTLMPILAAGKCASSVTSLIFFAVHQPAFLYLLNFLVDGSIVGIVLACYVWLGTEEYRSRPTALPRGRLGELLALLTSTMIPEGGAFGAGAATLQLDRAVWQYFGQLHPLGAAGLAAILYVIEFGPFVFGPRCRRFSRLSTGEREAYLAGWETSRLAPRRQLLSGLKLAVMLQFYTSPDACAAIGYDGAYLHEKLLAGPNAAFHRARMA
ncbi:MAG: hypothetical protein ACE5I7_02735 [Candidatus Binatia bacterium]